MQNYIDRALESFQPVFSRTSTWLLFCAIVIGFMGAGEMIGVTSLCRFWLLDEDGYNRLLVRPQGQLINRVKVPVGVSHNVVAESNCVIAKWGGEQLEAKW